MKSVETVPNYAKINQNKMVEKMNKILNFSNCVFIIKKVQILLKTHFRVVTL